MYRYGRYGMAASAVDIACQDFGIEDFRQSIYGSTTLRSVRNGDVIFFTG